ncbi:VTC domain-containing protein, partial [Candidatus Saccharibacteria bacterium]|nr:VTC domain-containing protein [Candidatus Saccharibacteria bacterium]
AKKIEQPSDMQIAKEVDYLVEHFNLKPRIIVYYDRTSFITDNGLRVTFDENLSFRNRNLKFFRKSNDKHYFNDEKNIIMEIKANGVMPLWLVKILSENKAYPQSFSKIGSVYETLRKEKNV